MSEGRRRIASSVGSVRREAPIHRERLHDEDVDNDIEERRPINVKYTSRDRGITLSASPRANVSKSNIEGAQANPETVKRNKRMFGSLIGHLGLAKRKLENDSKLINKQQERQLKANERQIESGRQMGAMEAQQRQIRAKYDEIDAIRSAGDRWKAQKMKTKTFIFTNCTPCIAWLPAKMDSRTELLLQERAKQVEAMMAERDEADAERVRVLESEAEAMATTHHHHGDGRGSNGHRAEKERYSSVLTSRKAEADEKGEEEEEGQVDIADTNFHLDVEATKGSRNSDPDEENSEYRQISTTAATEVEAENSDAGAGDAGNNDDAARDDAAGDDAAGDDAAGDDAAGDATDNGKGKKKEEVAVVESANMGKVGGAEEPKVAEGVSEKTTGESSSDPQPTVHESQEVQEVQEVQEESAEPESALEVAVAAAKPRRSTRGRPRKSK